MSVNFANPSKSTQEFKYWPLVYFTMAFVLAIFVYSEGLSYMLLDWQREEFSHGYMIPLISIYLALQKLPQLKGIKFSNQFIGVIVVALGLIGFLLGELSALYIIIQYSFIVVLVGIAISFLGLAGTAVISVPLIYLIFMIPLPNFLYFNLSAHLQLLSSYLGTMVLRLMDISVYLEGNVIDLGSYKLQVVDACSGLRYLFPLMSFGFLVACVYQAAFWKKAVIFLSTIPITILMNSLRITIIGITVDAWGIAAAEGFVHDFQGWAVFMVCLGLLTLELMLIHRLSGKGGSVFDHIIINLPKPIFSAEYFNQIKPFGRASIITLMLLAFAIPLKLILVERSETIPPRIEFSHLPLTIENWNGREGHFDQDVISALKLKDYIVADYSSVASKSPINLYMAYYESQRKGASIHSPKTCLPGGGWEIKNIEQIELEGVSSNHGKNLRVNRVITQKGEVRNLVYYWFQQRGRIITNEFEAKWYIFWDALTKNRTDGALVRVIIQIQEGESIQDAEKQLQSFVGKVEPLLSTYIPD